MAVSEKAIKTLSSSLPCAKDSTVAHTAGSVDLDGFPPAVKNKAVFYPLQTVSRGRDIDFRNVPILIEGSNNQSLAAVRRAAEIISDNVHEVDSVRRAMVHVSAVFVSNFTNYMYTIGEMLLKEAGEDFSLLKPLIVETALKAVEAESPRDVQTGPAMRNDFQTKSLHCELLEQKPDLKNIYINLSNNIWETSKKI